MRSALNKLLFVLWRRQTIFQFRRGGGEGVILQGITVCLVSTILSTMWWPCSFRTVSRGHILVFFQWTLLHNESCEREVGRTDPYGPQEMVIQAHQAFHFDDTTRHSPPPAGQEGRCPLNFLNLINLNFRVRAPNGCLQGFLYIPHMRSKVVFKQE